jgi:uncharacterized protein (UPF0335 family)
MPRKVKQNSDQPHGPGHNSLDRDSLRDIVSRIEAAEDERIAASENVRGMYAEAKSQGYDVAALRQVVKLRRQDKAELEARQAVVDSYLKALGDYASTDLGRAAVSRAAGLTPPV